MSNYEALRRQARTLESVLENKMAAYSRLGTSVSKNRSDYNPRDVESGNAVPERWGDLEAEVEGLLEKLKETVEDLAALLNNPENPPSQSMLHTIQRHRDVLEDYKMDFKRTRTNLKSALDRANLLGSVRSDISAFKAANASTTDALLGERDNIDNSHRITDAILEQAYETRQEFSRQRASLTGINSRMAGVLSSMPGIDNLLGMIRTRRRRDAVIIGVVLGLGLVLILMYHWG